MLEWGGVMVNSKTGGQHSTTEMGRSFSSRRLWKSWILEEYSNY
jgi:hypothetical protein